MKSMCRLESSSFSKTIGTIRRDVLLLLTALATAAWSCFNWFSSKKFRFPENPTKISKKFVTNTKRIQNFSIRSDRLQNPFCIVSKFLNQGLTPNPHTTRSAGCRIPTDPIRDLPEHDLRVIDQCYRLPDLWVSDPTPIESAGYPAHWLLDSDPRMSRSHPRDSWSDLNPWTTRPKYILIRTSINVSNVWYFGRLRHEFWNFGAGRDFRYNALVFDRFQAISFSAQNTGRPNKIQMFRLTRKSKSFKILQAV